MKVVRENREKKTWFQCLKKNKTKHDSFHALLTKGTPFLSSQFFRGLRCSCYLYCTVHVSLGLVWGWLLDRTEREKLQEFLPTPSGSWSPLFLVFSEFLLYPPATWFGSYLIQGQGWKRKEKRKKALETHFHHGSLNFDFLPQSVCCCLALSNWLAPNFRFIFDSYKICLFQKFGKVRKVWRMKIMYNCTV